MTATPAITTLNRAPRDVAVALLAPLVERSSWVAEGVVDKRPFDSADAIAAALVDMILTSGRDRQRALFEVHPDLAGREAAEGRMTDASTGEQGRLGLMSLDSDDARRLSQRNAAYRARFGHPFIIALHRIPDLEALFTVFDQRLGATPLEEHLTTLAEIASVIHARALDAFGDAASDTTHTPSPTPTPKEHSL